MKKKILIIATARKTQILQTIEKLNKEFLDSDLFILANSSQKKTLQDLNQKLIKEFFYYDESKFFNYEKFYKSKIYNATLKNKRFDMIVIVYNHNHLGGKYYEEIEKIISCIPHNKTAGFWLNNFFKIFDNEFISYKNKELKDFYIRKQMAIEEISEFTGETVEIVSKKIVESENFGFQKWEKLKNKKEEEILNFYLNADFYIYQLMKSNDFKGGRTEYIPILDKYINDKDVVVDYGCGIGQVGIELSKKCKKVYLADLNSKMFEFVRFRVKKRKLDIDFVFLNGKKEKIDLHFNKIICLDVIEHVVNPVEFLKNLYNYLFDDGLIILRIPFNEINPLIDGPPPLHFDYINENNYKEIFGLSRLKIEKEEGDLIILKKNKEVIL